MRHRKQPRRSGLMRSNNVLVFKLIDPICQSLFFILFVYVIDTDNGISGASLSYRNVLGALICLQVFSVFINFIINEPKQLKKERVFYLVAISLYLLFFFYVNKNVNEKFIDLAGGGGPMKLPVHELLLMAVALIITFSYFVICFREIRSLLNRVNNDS